MEKISAVDLFCGAGGLTHGLLKSKINVVAGIDIEESCKYAYEQNNLGAKFINKDVSKLSAREVREFYPRGDIKLLAGCAPCQPFSTYSQGRDTKSDKKWPLLYEFSRLIRGVKPELVTMENVPDVVKHEVYNDFVDELDELGYFVWSDTVFCPDYGIPQIRKRHVLIASKFNEISLIKPTKKPKDYKTVKDTIKKLPIIKAGEQDSKDRIHVSSNLSELNLKRIKASKPGGSWRDWPEDLLATCHTKDSGQTYSGVYARMCWNKPSPTITTQCFGYGNGRFGHPIQNRAISLREAAMLQTFPKSYKFISRDTDMSMKSIGKMIGNAVPVKLGKIIGKSLYKHVN